MTRLSNTFSLSERDVAYFVHLQLDTVERTGNHTFKEKHAVYRVEGKIRPMLVYSVPAHNRNGRRWYRVFPITSKGIGAEGRPKPGHIRIGRIAGAEKESFVRVLDAQELPENMLSALEDKSPICGSLDRLAFDNVVRIAQHCLMSQAPPIK